MQLDDSFPWWQWSVKYRSVEEKMVGSAKALALESGLHSTTCNSTVQVYLTNLGFLLSFLQFKVQAVQNRAISKLSCNHVLCNLSCVSMFSGVYWRIHEVGRWGTEICLTTDTLECKWSKKAWLDRYNKKLRRDERARPEDMAIRNLLEHPANGNLALHFINIREILH